MFNMTEKELMAFRRANSFYGGYWGSSEEIFCFRANPVASNITDLQLKKFKLTTNRELWEHIYKEEDDEREKWGMEDTIIRECFKSEWEKKIEKVNEEIEVAKYNPRNPLGKLEFDRRAEADGIIFEK